MKTFPIAIKLASNTGWLLLERAISLVVAVSVGFHFVRYLGPDNYGLYSYALGLYGIFAAASRLGINALVVNETVQDQSRHSVILGSAFALRLIASLACFLLLNIAAAFIMDEAVLTRMTLIFSATILFAPFETVTHWFEANVRMRSIAVARSLVSILLGLTRLGFIFAGVGLMWFAWLIPVEGLLTAVFFVLVYYSNGLKLGAWTADTLYIKKFIRDGAPLFLSALAMLTYMKIDQVMLGKMSSPREVGIYAAAVRISELFYFIPLILSGVLFPYLIKLQKRGEQFFLQAFQVICDGFAWIALIIGTLVTLFSERLIALAYGAEYLDASPILVVHVWAGLFVFLETLRIRWFVIREATVFQVITTSIGALANVLLNLFLIPAYSGFGAAMATTLSYGVAIVFSCFLYRKTWLIGTIMLKSLVAPFRALETTRTLKVIRNMAETEPSQVPLVLKP